AAVGDTDGDQGAGRVREGAGHGRGRERDGIGGGADDIDQSTARLVGPLAQVGVLHIGPAAVDVVDGAGGGVGDGGCHGAEIVHGQVGGGGGVGDGELVDI